MKSLKIEWKVRLGNQGGEMPGRGSVCGKGRVLRGAVLKIRHQNWEGGKDMPNPRGLKSGSPPGQTARPTKVGRRLLTCLRPHHPNQPSGTSVLAGKRKLRSQTQSFLPQPCDIPLYWSENLRHGSELCRMVRKKSLGGAAWGGRMGRACAGA